MLERTAAGLESSNLNIRRVLSRPTSSSTRLPGPPRTGFSHGRGSWQRRSASTRKASISRNEQRHDDAPVSASASAAAAAAARVDGPVVLDFLYPRQTKVLLRQNPPSSPASSLNHSRYGAGRVGTSRDHRPSSSSVSTAQAITTGSYSQTASVDEHPPPPLPKPQSSRWDEVTVPPKNAYPVHGAKGADVTVDAAELTAEQDVLRGASSSRPGNGATLSELLADEEGRLFHDVWDIYCRLSPAERSAMQPLVVQYLSRSQSVVETGRALSLFRQVDVSQWDDKFLSASVLVLLRSGNQERAISVFKTGLRSSCLTGGLEYLLIDTVSKQQWATLLDVWTAYCSNLAQAEPSSMPRGSLLEPIGSLQSLGALYFSFERYLAADEGRVERWLDLDKTSRPALRLLRRTFATKALREPCPPRQASVILSFWRDPTMYENYLWRMLDRWYTKKISTSTARMLVDIYQDFKSLPGAKPSVDIMRGIFKLHYPNGVTALEGLYQDWIKSRGELSLWGFEKFLKFFAHRGDVKQVRELWKRYVEIFPWKLETPRGFHSIMNAYAQAGDVAGAEEELDRIINHYKVEPDLGIWNMLLKCYMRAEDYPKVLACFQEVSKMHKPDSFTYAHVMAMCSKKGDLEQTIHFFNEAQKNGVPISREMGLALVAAYCHNDKLLDAEKICTALAQRKITSTAVWNQLLLHNGMHGRLDKCYELLNAMKRYNLEWDHNTISHLLNALVRVNQVSPAFQVVRDASKNRLHVLQPEHFSIVMLGAVRTGDRPTAEALMSLMESLTMPVPFNAMVAYTHAALREAPNMRRTPQLGKQIVASLRRLVGEPGNDVRKLKLETRKIGRAVQLLVMFRDFTSVEELVNLFTDLFPQYKDGGEALPQDVLASLMFAYHRDGSYDSVIELWDQTWPLILKRCSTPDGTGIYPAHQYDVTRLVYRLAETFRAMDDGEGLLACVGQVTSAGFKLTSSTWDRVICGLADMGQWEPAMDWCETILMPEWRGWNPRPKSLSARREALNPRALQPTPHAVLALQTEWLEKRRLAAWSADVARRLADVEHRYPILHHAFTTSDYGDVNNPGPEAPWVVRGDLRLDRAITDILTPLPLSELRAMQNSLRRRERAMHDAAAAETTNPFRVLEDGRRTRAMLEGELKQLRSVLSQMLSRKKDD
ncbi:pentatricopeptide repeat-containing protein PET309 [Geosmithia morbida]|uniref:Pentatricopeptide repeat-containing protein PET309 n=1 Tax=Geosmithia morbida TaxID=1094350 RepID=A0A9P4Z0R1_9HYPO|nr:pentatricopeptide repeat-containing protein PET309 [Geosmithia morbida]KAF4126578.1 pentatricopeptide repeat-containing protein PET309 [Geosmithia morbida]